MFRKILAKLNYCLKCWDVKGAINKMRYLFVQYPSKRFYKCPVCSHYDWRE